MSELSGLLKQARIAKGYTIDKLHKITKIPTDVIEALESGKFEEITNLHYAKVYIKKYAKHVDLDPLELMEEYGDFLNVLFSQNEQDDEEDYEEDEEWLEEDDEDIPSRFERYHLPSQQPIWNFLIKYLPIIGLVALILGIMGTIIVTINRINSENKTNIATEQTISSDEIISSVEPNSSQEPQSTQPVESNLTENISQDLVLLSDDPNPTIYEVEDVSKLSMTIEALGTVWIGYFEDDTLVEEHLLNAGETIEFTPTASQQARLEFGYKEGVKLLVNNKEIPLTNVTQPNQIEFITKEEAQKRQLNAIDERNNTPEVQEQSEIDAEPVEGSNEEEAFQGPAVLDPNYQPGGE